MNVREFLRAHVEVGDRFERAQSFDPERFDYTIVMQRPGGVEITTLRNPSAADDGVLIDRAHNIPDGSQLVALGTAFWEWTARQQHTIGIDVDTDHKHKDGLDSGEFAAALEAVRRVPWLEARRSTGGQGLHVFPHFTHPVAVSTRAEASALAHGLVKLLNSGSIRVAQQSPYSCMVCKYVVIFRA